MVVFRRVEGGLPPDRWYTAGRSVLETAFLNNDRLPQVDDPAVIREYFERLYRIALDLIATGKAREIERIMLS